MLYAAGKARMTNLHFRSRIKGSLDALTLVVSSITPWQEDVPPSTQYLPNKATGNIRESMKESSSGVQRAQRLLMNLKGLIGRESHGQDHPQ